MYLMPCIMEEIPSTTKQWKRKATRRRDVLAICWGGNIYLQLLITVCVEEACRCLRRCPGFLSSADEGHSLLWSVVVFANADGWGLLTATALSIWLCHHWWDHQPRRCSEEPPPKQSGHDGVFAGHHTLPAQVTRHGASPTYTPTLSTTRSSTPVSLFAPGQHGN